MSINDQWVRYLAAEGYVGNVNDMLQQALQSETSSSSKQLNTLWYEYLRGEGYTGSLNDMMYQWLGDKGYTGSLNDRWMQALINDDVFGGTGPIAILGSKLVGWYTSDPSTLFTTSTGETPATAAGDPVGLRVNKVRGGPNAVQTTQTARPTLRSWPSTGRRNLLTNSVFTGATSGTPGTAPTGWAVSGTGGTQTYDSETESLRISASSASHGFMFGFSGLVAGSTLTFSIQINVVQPASLIQLLCFVGLPTGSTQSYTLDGVSVAGNTVPSVGSHKAEVTLVSGGSVGSSTLRFGIGVSNPSSGDVIFSEPQFEVGSVATAYQRVANEDDITEAGVESRYFLHYDGLDDGFTITLPTISGGQIVISSQAGIWIDSLDFAGGTFSLRSPTYTGGHPGLWSILGNEDLQVCILDEAMTSEEQSELVAYLVSQGSPGLITLGGELFDATIATEGANVVQDGTNNDWTIDYSGPNNNAIVADAGLSALSGKKLLVSFEIYDYITGAVRDRVQGVSGPLRSANGYYGRLHSASRTVDIAGIGTSGTTALKVRNYSIREVIYP